MKKLMQASAVLALATASGPVDAQVTSAPNIGSHKQECLKVQKDYCPAGVGYDDGKKHQIEKPGTMANRIAQKI